MSLEFSLGHVGREGDTATLEGSRRLLASYCILGPLDSGCGSRNTTGLVTHPHPLAGRAPRPRKAAGYPRAHSTCGGRGHSTCQPTEAPLPASVARWEEAGFCSCGHPPSLPWASCESLRTSDQGPRCWEPGGRGQSRCGSGDTHAADPLARAPWARRLWAPAGAERRTWVPRTPTVARHRVPRAPQPGRGGWLGGRAGAQCWQEVTSSRDPAT